MRRSDDVEPDHRTERRMAVAVPLCGPRFRSGVCEFWRQADFASNEDHSTSDSVVVPRRLSFRFVSTSHGIECFRYSLRLIYRGSFVILLITA